MSKRLMAWKRSLILLSMGGSTMDFLFNSYSCAQNVDFTNILTQAGTASLDALSDGVFNDNKANSDYDLIVRGPATTFVKALWSEFVFTQFPQDPQRISVAPVVKP